MVFDTTLFAGLLTLVLTIAAVGVVLTTAVTAQAVLTHRRERLAQHQSVRAYYGRLAFQH
jgi:hypothetical protein